MLEESKHKVVIGKIHISKWLKDDFENRLLELISCGDEYIPEGGKGAGKFIWVFGDPLSETIDNEKIIFARLGKIKKTIVDMIFDRERKSFKRIKVSEPRALRYSNFIIHPKSHTILFEEKLPDISIKQFKEIFSMLYVRHFNDLSSVRIDLVVEDMERVFDILKQYDKIVEVQVKTTPSNPEDTPDFRRLDPLLKESYTKEANLRFKNEEEGLKVKGTIIGEGISLSGAGHGEYAISVEKEERREIIRSKDQISRTVIRAIDEPKELMWKFVEKLKQYLQKRK